MSKDISYIRTDLALESREAAEIKDERGIDYREEELFGIPVMYMEIKTKEGEKIIGKEIGRYTTLEIGRSWLLSDEERENAEKAMAQVLISFIGKGSENDPPVLVVGLGNRDVTADALGPRSIDGLLITRHIKDYDKSIFEKLSQEEVAAFAPGVVGQTGIETLELIKGAVKAVKPRALIVIDALAARSVDRLATTVQLSDTGIAPGSGIGNKRKKIDKKSLGVPVIAIGVPTVVDSSTLVRDALEKAGIEDIKPELEEVLENGRNFFVSLKESDTAIAETSKLISQALNAAFSKA